MQLCRPPVLHQWENQRMLSSFVIVCLLVVGWISMMWACRVRHWQSLAETKTGFGNVDVTKDAVSLVLVSSTCSDYAMSSVIYSLLQFTATSLNVTMSVSYWVNVIAGLFAIVCTLLCLNIHIYSSLTSSFQVVALNLKEWLMPIFVWPDAVLMPNRGVTFFIY